MTVEAILSLRKSQKLHSKRSGEYSSWEMAGIWFFTNNCCTAKEAWQGTLARCRTQLFLHFPTNSIPQTLQNFNIRAEFTACPTGINSWCTTPKLGGGGKQLSADILWPMTSSFVVTLWCANWRIVALSQNQGKDQDLSTVSDRRSASFTDHLKTSALMTYLLSIWSSIRMHGINFAHHTDTLFRLLWTDLYEMPLSFPICSTVHTDLISQLYELWPHFLLFFNTAGLPMHS